jgi:putative SOS response-associated peptidase YedK
MCSRYFLDDDGNIIAHTFQVPVHDRIRRRFNIAPTQEAPIIRAAAQGGREVALLRWGLVPPWAKELAIGNRMINARSETVREKPAFRDAFRQRRCVVPASGFFEWTGEPKWRVPHAVTLEDRPLLSFAGLWESWKDAAGRPIETYTIITTPANRFMSGMHDRMPAILGHADVERWISATPDEAWPLIKPHADEPMRAREVTRALNSVAFESEDALCLDPKAFAAQPAKRAKAPPNDDSGQQSLF